MSLFIDSRKNRSSSTIETNDAFGIRLRHFEQTRHTNDRPQRGRTGPRIPVINRGQKPVPASVAQPLLPPQNVAGAASEAISLGLGWVDDPLHREPVRADRLALDWVAEHRQCPLPTGRLFRGLSIVSSYGAWLQRVRRGHRR